MQSFTLTNFDPPKYKLNNPTDTTVHLRYIFSANSTVFNFVRFVQMSQLHHLNEAYKIKDSGTCQKILP